MANPYVYYRIDASADLKRDAAAAVCALDWHRDIEMIRAFYARFTDARIDPVAMGPEIGDPLAVVEDGRVVSFAAPFSFRAGETEIGAAATLPEMRGRGFCKAVIAEMAFRILERGEAATLTTHRDNLPMRAAAEAIGMRPVR